MKLSIIIPAYNEERYIEPIIRRVLDVPLLDRIAKEIVVVDDCSTDKTYQRLEQFERHPFVQIIRHPRNLGKTASIMSGIQKSTGDFVLIQDADLEYDPIDYVNLLKPVMEEKLNVVAYGSRWLGSIENMELINRISNIISTKTVNILYGLHLTDIYGCYKVFPKELFKKVKINSSHFTFDSEITAKLLSLGYKIVEVPIYYKARSRKEGKKINWRKALLMYWGLIKYKFVRDNE